MNIRVRNLAATLRRAFVLLVASTLLAACSGGGGGGNPPKNKLPTANAGIDAVVREAGSVSFDGRESTDADGTIAGYAWTASGDVAITLDDANTAQPSFTAPDVETDTSIELTLEITDNKGGKASDTLGAIIFHHVDGNTPPTPVAKPVPDTAPGGMVTLDASDSVDDNGSVTAYAWVQLAGETVELFGADSAIATFQAPEVGAETGFLFRLFVTDDAGERNAIDVPVTVKPAGDQPPVANAGADQVVNAGDVVQLEGSASSDAETGELVFAWTQVEGNDTLAVTLDDSTSPAPSFTLPDDLADETVLVFELTVTDAAQQTATDSVAVTVRPRIAGNQLPVAVAAGPGEPVIESIDVFLNGDDSQDADGSIASYQWVQIGAPPVVLDGANTAQARFTTPLVTQDTTLRFRLTVTDNRGAVASDTVDVVITDSNQPPRAVAKANGSNDSIEVVEGLTVSLDGRDSIDDGGITSYTWSSEDARVALIANPANPALASFVAPAVDEDTDFRIDLVVTDGEFEDADSISVTVMANRPPVVNAGIDRIVNAGDAVVLAGSGSDPEGEPITVAWTQVAAEGVPNVVLANANTFSPGFTAPAGIAQNITLTFRLTVRDNDGNDSSDTVNVTVVPLAQGNTPPVANAGANQTVDESTVVTLDGRASRDPDDGDATLTFAWTQTGLGAGDQPVVLANANTAQPSFTAPAVATAKTLSFQLVVTDEQGAVSAPATVTVAVRDTGADVTPDPMTFTAVTGVEIHQNVTSNAVIVTGVDSPVAARLQITAGSPGTAFMRVTRALSGEVNTFAVGTINPFDRIELVTQPRTLGENVVLRLVFGDLAAPLYQTTWSVTAKLTGDLSPAPFDLQDIAAAAPGFDSFTNVVTPTGFDTASQVAITGTGATFAVSVPTGGDRSNVVRPGESFKVRVRPNSGNYEQTHTVTVRMGETTETFDYTTRARDETPEFAPDPIPAIEGAEAETRVSSIILSVTGFDEDLTATVDGDPDANAQLTVISDFASPGDPVSSANVRRGDRLFLHATSAAFDPEGGEVSRAVTLTIGTESREFVVTTRAPNRVPGIFTLSRKTDAAVGAPVRSDPLTIPAVEVPVPVVITAVSENAIAVLLKNGEPVASDGSVSAGPEDQLVVELTTPEELSVTVSATVTVGLAGVGQQAAVFEVTTAAVDTTPDDFDFAAVSEAVRGELVESNSVVIAGITDGQTAETLLNGDEGASYAIRRVGEPVFSAFTTGASTISNGDEIKVRVRAATAFATVTRAQLEVGGRLEEFAVTSEIDAAPPQVEITFPINGALFNAEMDAGGISQQTVFAKVSDNDEITSVRINDRDATFDAAVGQWKARVNVGPGENRISVVSEDPAGNVGEAELSVLGETGMFGDMEKIRWAGGKLYAAASAGTASRLLEVDPATGVRRTIKLTGVNGVSDFVPDDVDNPTRFYILSSANDIIFVFDIATGAGTLVSASTQTPDIFTNSPLQVVTNASGTHLLAAVTNSTDGARLIQVLPDGTRRVVATLAGYGVVNGFTVVGTTGWLFARDAFIGSSGVIVRIDLSDLENVVMTDQRTVSAEVLAPITFSEPAQLQVDVVDGDGEPLLFVLGSQAIVALQSDGLGSTLVTAGDRGAGPNMNYIAYEGLTMSPSGGLYVVDEGWSSILRVDRASGDRTVLSGLHGGQVPADDTRPFMGLGAAPVLGMAALPDGRLIAERGFDSIATGPIRKVASFDVIAGSWGFLFDGQLDVDFGGAFEFLAVNETEFLVGHSNWRTPVAARQGIGRIFKDADTGEWRQELLSVAADGKAAGEDWNFLRSAAHDPASGDIWVLSSFGDDFKLFRVDAATGNRSMAMDLPATIGGFQARSFVQSVHRLIFAEDGRLFWLADSTAPSQERVFLIDREAQSVSLYSDAGFITSPDDLVVDESLQLAYLAGDFASRVSEMDILPGSAGEGTGGSLPTIPFPSLNAGPTTSDQANLAFDSERRRLWVYQPRLRTMYLLQPDTGEAVMLPKH